MSLQKLQILFILLFSFLGCSSTTREIRDSEESSIIFSIVYTTDGFKSYLVKTEVEDRSLKFRIDRKAQVKLFAKQKHYEKFKEWTRLIKKAQE